MILPGGEVFFVNYSALVFGDSSLYLSKTFYLTTLSKHVLEAPSLATMNSKRVYLRAMSRVFYAFHWHSTMLKVFHALFMWMILPSMYLVPNLQVWSVSFRRQLIELSNELIPMASSFQLLKQKQYYFIINERWLVYLLLICMVN